MAVYKSQEGLTYEYLMVEFREFLEKLVYIHPETKLNTKLDEGAAISILKEYSKTASMAVDYYHGYQHTKDLIRKYGSKMTKRMVENGRKKAAGEEE